MAQNTLIGAEYVSNFIKPRPRDAHKGNCGRVLVIAGSKGMMGAAVLCTKAALKTGSGLVSACVPEEQFNIVQISVPEAMCISREELISGQLKNKLKEFNSIAMGPGLGVSQDNYKLIENVLNNTECMVVIDADGINTLCEFDKEFSLIRKYGNRIVLTPHPGEANRILKCAGETSVSQLGREAAVRKLADFAGATVLLKGEGTLVTAVGDEITVNTTGNPGMATGGSGDVLTGVVASLGGIGYNGCVAARTGAYLHGFAGDIAADKIGQWGMTAMDIVDLLPEAIRRVAGI